MIYHVFACKSNIGDWLSALGIQELLKPLTVKEHYCDEPFVAGSLASLQKAGPSDLIVIGGGGLFMDYFQPFWEGLRARALKAPVVVWGVGFCDLKSQQSRLDDGLLRSILSSVQLCLVRDHLTLERLGNVASGPVPCPTLAYLTAAESSANALLHVVHYDVIGADVHDKTVRIVKEFAGESGFSYAEIDNQIRDGDRAALDRQLELYRKARVVVSSRLHGCIIGLALGKKVLAVSGDWKVESFMRAASLGEWVCPSEEVQRLPSYLSRLDKQLLPEGFLRHARMKNREVAERVHALALDSKPLQL